MNFQNVKTGMTVTRLLAGAVPMELKVSAVDEQFIHCGVPGYPEAEGWKFWRDNGAEVDEELGWDGIHVTGSYLIAYTEEATAAP